MMTRESRLSLLRAPGFSFSLLMHSQVDVSFTRGTDFLQFAAIGLLIALERLAVPVAAAERLRLRSSFKRRP